MAQELAYTLIAVIIISLIAFTGALILILNRKLIDKLLSLIVAFAAGALLGAAFFDLIPESFKALGNYFFVVIGILLFFLIESFLHWHHVHKSKICIKCKKNIKPVAYLNLIGDGLHNFLDGIIISAGFLININTGIMMAIAIALHEIPQEIGDFAILIHGGLTKIKALFFNFLSALTAILGALIGYFALSQIEFLIPYIIAIAAVGFIYIAGADIIPELHRTKDYKKIILQTLFLILGIVFIGMLV